MKDEWCIGLIETENHSAWVDFYKRRELSMSVHTSKVAGIGAEEDLGTIIGSYSHQTHFNDYFLGKKEIGDKKIPGEFYFIWIVWLLYNENAVITHVCM